MSLLGHVHDGVLSSGALRFAHLRGEIESMHVSVRPGMGDKPPIVLHSKSKARTVDVIPVITNTHGRIDNDKE